jgi:hypothetical protein
MKKWSCIFLLAVGLTAIVSSRSHAISTYLDDFNGAYGTTGTRLDQCILCHTTNDPNTNSARNPFGLDFGSGTRVAGHTAHAFDAALNNYDSDGDSITNTLEISARTFPGNPTDPGLSLTITAPTAGVVVPSGSTYTILYDAPADVTSVKVKYSIDGGLTWLTAVDAGGSVLGSFNWDVPTLVKNTTKALVKVIGFNASVKVGVGKSAKFTVEVVSITAPLDTDIVPKGTLSYPVTWTTNGTKGTVSSAKVFYTYGSSGIWKRAKGVVDPLLGSFSWDVPSPAKTKIVKLKVVLRDDALGVNVGIGISKAFIVQ